jgi:hypothetical protein
MKKYQVIDSQGNTLADFDKKQDALDYYVKNLRAQGFISPKPMEIPKRSKVKMEVKIDGVEYVPVKPTEEPVYYRGDRFKHNHKKYILAHVDCGRAAIICLEDGYRWCSPIKVKNATKITEKEFERICLFCTFTRYWDRQKGELTEK